MTALMSFRKGALLAASMALLSACALMPGDEIAGKSEGMAAQDESESGLGQYCDEAMSQADLNACSYKAYQARRAALEAAFGERITMGEENQQEAWSAVDAMVFWRSFAEAECRTRVGPRDQGGSMWPLQYNGCLADLYLEQLGSLQRSQAGQ